MCESEVVNRKDLNLVAGSEEFRPINAIVELSFRIENTSPYMCRKCKAGLNSFIKAKERARKLEVEVKETYQTSGFNVETLVAPVSDDNLLERYEPRRESKEIQTNLSFQFLN